MKIAVVIPTYNPNADRLESTLRGLARQTLAAENWECVLVDNASSSPVDQAWCETAIGRNVKLIREPVPGLSSARLAGIHAASAELVVFCDDDNVLCPNYLELAFHLMDRYPGVGVAGGKSLPLYLEMPPAWFVEGLAPLGCRDLGEDPKIHTAKEYEAARCYPVCAPIGAGMVFRKKAMLGWIETVGRSGISDRKGKNLSSAGDCDMVLHALKFGCCAAYWPELVLEHLMPAERLTKEYLGALSRAAYRDFVRVLAIHGVCPWPAIPAWTVRLRTAKAWASCQAWRGPANWIRWQGAIGQFEGRSLINR